MELLMEEKQGDALAARETNQREQELRQEASALIGRVRRLGTRGKELRAQVKPGVTDPDELVRLEGALEDLEEDIADCRWEMYRMVSSALAWNYTPPEVKAWCDRALEMGAAHPQFDPVRMIAELVHLRKVPNAPFRERYLQLIADGQLTVSDITLRTYRYLRMIEKEQGEEFGSRSLVVVKTISREDRNATAHGAFDGEIPQTRELERWLGLATKHNGQQVSLRLFVTYEQATALSRALDMTPHQAGI